MTLTKRRLLWPVVAVALSGVVAVNVIAFNQAGAMTEFVAAGERTQKPEQLTALERAWVVLSGVTVPRPRNTTTPRDHGLPFQEVSIRSAEATLSAWVIAEPDPRFVVLLFHGYAASKESLIPTAAAFRGMGVSSVLVEFYGSGDSTGNGTTIGVKEAADVAAAAAYARGRWPDARVVLYGFSMGGAAILCAIATRGLEPDAIVLESVFDRLANAVSARFEAMGLPPHPLGELLLFWGGRRWGFDAFGHDPCEYAKSVQCPALVIVGDDDARVSREQAFAVQRNIHHASKLVVVPGMSHEPAVVAAPETWRTAMSRFFSAQLLMQE